MAPRRKSAALEPFYASDYFDQIYEYALALIRKGQAYVCDLSPEETERYRGSPDKPGRDSPFRNRTVAENLDLFQRMKAGEFPNGARTLRAKIDMAAPNIWLRDPVLYRIRHAEHHHTGDAWCIYPMYDFAHCLSDYIEGITHSICTLEFEVHRPLYDWILERARPAPAAAAPVRIRAAERRLHRHEQAQAAPARAGEDRQRLGRSAHADHLRPAPPRRSRERAARFRLQHRRDQIRQPDRRGRARTRHPRGAEPDRAAPPGRAPAGEGRADEPPRRRGDHLHRGQQSRGRGRRHPPSCR